MLADPHTLVLDEATSLIDPRAARHLERSLAAVLHGRTVVAIAHRLFTAHDADRVAVVADGKITEIGSHDELIASGWLVRRALAVLARREPTSPDDDGVPDGSGLPPSEAEQYLLPVRDSGHSMRTPGGSPGPQARPARAARTGVPMHRRATATTFTFVTAISLVAAATAWSATASASRRPVATRRRS